MSNSNKEALLVVIMVSAMVLPFSGAGGEPLTWDQKLWGKHEAGLLVWKVADDFFYVLPLSGKKMSCSPAAWIHLNEEGRIPLPPESVHWLVGGGSTTPGYACPVMPETISTVWGFGVWVFFNWSLWSSIRRNYWISYTSTEIDWYYRLPCLDVIWSSICTPLMWWLLIS